MTTSENTMSKKTGGKTANMAKGKKMTGAEMVLQALRDNGVDTIFGYPGGAVLPIYDEIFQQDDVRHILVRHEQGAGHAAEGYARSTGRVGVLLVTSGPGATNAVTPLQDALMDSIPLVCITGQVPTGLIGSDAFQEADTVGITRPCTKHNWLVSTVEELPRILHEAFYVAKSGRPDRCWLIFQRMCSLPAGCIIHRSTSRSVPISRDSRAISKRLKKRYN